MKESYIQLEWTKQRVIDLAKARKPIDIDESTYRGPGRERMLDAGADMVADGDGNTFNWIVAEIERLDAKWNYPAPRPEKRMLTPYKVHRSGPKTSDDE